MERLYSSGTNQGIDLFLGIEIEHTPAHGMKTLFVVGVHPTQDIEKVLDAYPEIEHIYFGANMSFPKISTNDVKQWDQWENMIMYFLKNKYWCSLDMDSSCVEGLAESALTEDRRFIPIISVKVPYARLLGYNATIKIDDNGFDRSNPGVWCHQLSDLMCRSKFTNWDQYSKDEILERQ